MASLVAGARRADGIPALRPDPALAEIAQAHAERMRDAHQIFHNEDLAAGLAVLDWEWAGENVGRGPTVRAIQDAFMASHAHRDNILDARFTVLGIGVATDGDGTYFVTQLFARLRSAPSPSALVRSEDGTLVPASFYAGPCGRTLSAEDGSVVPASFYADCNGGP
jgi:hypothetical protein